MGKEKRPEPSSPTASPGPGTYIAKGSFGEGAKIALGPRIPDQTPCTNPPGPGTYNPNKEKVMNATASAGIGFGLRSSIDSPKTHIAPGPGAYDTQKKTISGSKFGTSTRPDIAQKSVVPGPGNYQIKSTIADLPGYAMSKMK